MFYKEKAAEQGVKNEDLQYISLAVQSPLWVGVSGFALVLANRLLSQVENSEFCLHLFCHPIET